jgi:nitrate/TMAO reductase-like tetraheme cytochrome c subunit
VPDKVELYSPYNNRECLYCHGGARAFEESDVHEGMEEEFAENEISCLECHDMTHAVDEVEELDLWEPLIK